MNQTLCRCGKMIHTQNQFNKCGYCLTKEESTINKLETLIKENYWRTPNDKQLPSQTPTHFICRYLTDSTAVFDKMYSNTKIGVYATNPTRLLTELQKGHYEEQQIKAMERLQAKQEFLENQEVFA